MPILRLIRKSRKQKHVDHCAKYLVDHDLAWFTEAQEYLGRYWEEQDMQRYFKDYREFLEEISYTVDWILLGNKTKPNTPLHLVADNSRRRNKG